MFTFLSSFKFMAIIGAVMLAGMGFFWIMWKSSEADLTALNSRYATLESSHYSTLSTLTLLELDLEKSASVVNLEIIRRRNSDRANRKLIEVINNAPSKGCVGPAVMSLFDGMLRARKQDDNKN